MNHDCAKEIAEAVREATAPLKAEIDQMVGFLNDRDAEIDALEATIRDVNGLSEIRLQRIAERDATIANSDAAVREATAPLEAEIGRLRDLASRLNQDGSDARAVIRERDATIADLRRQLAEERDARSIAETALTDCTRLYTRLYSEQSERNRALIDTVARLDGENAELRACRTATPNPIASVLGAPDEDGELVAVDFFDATGLVLGGVDVTAGKVVWSVAGGESGSTENIANLRAQLDEFQSVFKRDAAISGRDATIVALRAEIDAALHDLRTVAGERDSLSEELECVYGRLDTAEAALREFQACRTDADVQRVREGQRTFGERCVLCGRTDGQCWHGDDDWPGRDGGIDA